MCVGPIGMSSSKKQGWVRAGHKKPQRATPQGARPSMGAARRALDAQRNATSSHAPREYTSGCEHVHVRPHATAVAHVWPCTCL